MKLKVDRQAVLKGLLLTALIANMSWRPALRSLNLSSEAVSSAPQAPATAPDPSPSPKPPAVNAAAPNDQGPHPDAPAKPDAANVPPAPPAKTQRVEVPKICGQRFYVTYSENGPSSDLYTLVTIKPQTGLISGFNPIKFQFAGGFSTNLDNADLKKDNDGKLQELIRSRLGHCQEDTEVVPATDNSTTTSTTKADKDALKLAIKECRKNRKGEVLTEIERARCSLNQLDNIDVDPDKRGSAYTALSKIEKVINGSLRNSIKNRLMSKDSGKVDEGEDLLQEALDKISDLSTSLNLDPQRLARLKSGLESLRAGGETYRKSVEMDEQVKSAQTALREELMQAKQNLRLNPNSPEAMLRYRQVSQEMMASEIQFQNDVRSEIGNGPYTSLVAAMRLGNISSTEFGQFAQPYQTLNSDMLSLGNENLLLGNTLGTTLGTSLTPSIGALNGQLPSNFQQYRTNLNSSLQPNTTLTMPQRPAPIAPTVSQNLYLSNASIFNRGPFNSTALLSH